MRDQHAERGANPFHASYRRELIREDLPPDWHVNLVNVPSRDLSLVIWVSPKAVKGIGHGSSSIVLSRLF